MAIDFEGDEVHQDMSKGRRWLYRLVGAGVGLVLGWWAAGALGL
ncbi:MAG: hypothetical protein OER86_11885 [Phycisphaerae bacterium]|nr:hypothetical protein [Phycisphaerae bacterium]